MNIAQFKFQGPENEECQALVAASEQENLAIITYRVAMLDTDHFVEFGIEFETTEGALRISGLAIDESSYVRCLAACGLSHLVAEILDCWKGGARDPGSLLRCLRGKGNRLTKELLRCAVGCLTEI